MMYLIFSFSSQDAAVSSSLSHSVSTRIVQAGNTLLDLELESWQIENYAGKVEFLIRKCAHIFEYFLLAVSVSFPLYVYGLHGILLMLLAGGICAAYAALDEYHQTFVLGRSGSPRDVAVDAIGIFAGIILVRIIGWTGRHTIFPPVSDDSSSKELAQARRELSELRRQQAQMQKELDRRDREASRKEEKISKRRHRGVSENKEAYYEKDYPQDHYYQNEYPQDPYYPGSTPQTGFYQDDYPNESYDGEYYDEEYYDGEYYDEFDNGYPDEYGPERPEEGFSDDLSEDMPFSHLLNRRKHH